MAKSSSSNVADDPAQDGAGGADAPSGGVGNANLGSLDPESRGRQRRRAVPLRGLLDALYHDTIATSEAARRWFDGPGRLWREELAPEPALAVSMEALGVTTRLLSVMNWLLDPAHDGDITSVGPIACPLPPPLPADHPLLATEGAPAVLASRQMLARAHQIAANHGAPA
ncbi:DUF1465 family protein [Sandarakinorhabdus oryzae]|uniref:DUF1465 family protein n=1 Tax=Sandarakinorhabdus oryzae TaxID=2675220 RepID=UPI0018CC5C43|nr:DUF1465 family protein [Sandarakinorhabdus oryzae]